MDCFNSSSALRNVSHMMTEGRLSAHVVNHVKFYVMDIVVPCMCALGLVGNLLSLVVLATEKLQRALTKMEMSAHIGLMALAVSDFLFCLLVLIFTQASLKPFYELGNTMIYFDYLANGLITLFIISSTWLIVVMAAERYIAVCHPLQARKLISLKRTRASVIIVFVMCSLSTIPIFLERRISQVNCSDGRLVNVLVERSEAFVRFRRLLWAIVYDFIPSASLVYFNLCLIVQIRKANDLRGQMSPKHSVLLYTSNGTRTSLPQFDCTQKSAVNNKNSKHVLIIDNMKTQLNLHSMNPAERFERVASNIQGNKCNDTTKTEKQDFTCNWKKTKSKSSCVLISNDKYEQSNSFNGHCTETTGNRSAHVSVPSAVTAPRKRSPETALNSVTATLVAIVLLFLILVSPSELLKFSVSYTSADVDQKLLVTYVTNFMQVLNFSLNFVLYCAVNKTFRQTLRGLIYSCWVSVRR